jgi:hypothetical protein
MTAPPCPDWYTLAGTPFGRDQNDRIARAARWAWDYAEMMNRVRPRPIPSISQLLPPPPAPPAPPVDVVRGGKVVGQLAREAIDGGSSIRDVRPAIPVSPGAVAIATERIRQQQVEGYTAGQDAKLTAHQLPEAALAYLTWVAKRDEFGDDHGRRVASMEWPTDFDPAMFKPTADDARNLAIAGAFIAAELDRRHAAGEPIPLGNPGRGGVSGAILPQDNASDRG